MTTLHRSKEGAQLLEQGYRDLLSRWPVPHQELRFPSRRTEGGHG